MDDDILRLTAALIDEYRQDGYPADHLEPGDWVWLDDGGELYVTVAELQHRIGELEALLRAGDWPPGWHHELDTLRSALRRLMGVSHNG